MRESKHFRNGKANAIALSGRLEDIPEESWDSLAKKANASKKKAPALSEWKAWLLGKDDAPAPGRYPTKAVSKALSNWDASTIEQALRQTMRGAEGISCVKQGSQATGGWLAGSDGPGVS